MSATRRRVAVIGGGVVGCAVAYELSRDGFAVTLIERDAIAAHASGCSAGNLNPLHGTPPALLPVTLEAFRLHSEIRSELAKLGCTTPAAQPVERLHLGYEDADRPGLEETEKLFRATQGFDAMWLDRDAVRAREPRLGPDVRFGVVTRGNLSIDSRDFTYALADGAAKLGATILHQAAIGVAAQGERVIGVRTGQGVIPCDDVVLATGPWIADMKSWLGIDVAVQPVKGQILLMRLRDGASRYDLTWGPISLYRRRDDEVWVGVTLESCGFDSTPTEGGKRYLLDSAARIMPEIRDADLLDHVAGLRPVATPNAPIVARGDGWRNVFVANGAGAKGVLLSVGMARAIRDLLAEGRADSSLAGPNR
jgi:glycine oxidase